MKRISILMGLILVSLILIATSTTASNPEHNESEDDHGELIGQETLKHM